MDFYRKTAIIVGVLFITATVAFSLGTLILTPILDGPDYLTEVSANENIVIIGVILQLINCAAVVAIPVMLFPIFKKHNEALALGYVGSRIIESVVVIVGLISLLSLLTLSQDYIAGALHISYYQSLGTSLLAVIDWTHILGIMIVFSLTALILNYLLYQSKLIPRFISGWGLIGAISSLIGGLLGLFGFSSAIASFLALPIAVQEMVFAVWLIVKGFSTQEIKSKNG